MTETMTRGRLLLYVALVVVMIAAMLVVLPTQKADARWNHSSSISKSCPYGQDVHLYGWVRWVGAGPSNTSYPLLTRKMNWWSWGDIPRSTTYTANRNVLKTATWKHKMTVDTNRQSVYSASFSSEVHWWDRDNQSRITAGCGS